MKKVVKNNYNKRSEVIRSGIDQMNIDSQDDSFDLLAKKYSIKTKKYILAIGIAAPYRNFEILIKVSPLLPDGLKLLIVAPNFYGKSYSKRLKKLTINKLNIIHIEDFISEEEKYLLLKNSLVFVFPNRDQTWGLAPLEALSVKTPVIVSNECGISEVLTNQKDSLLFDPTNSDELLDKILKIYNDRFFSKFIAIEGFNLINTQLTWERYTNNIISYLNEQDI